MQDRFEWRTAIYLLGNLDLVSMYSLQHRKHQSLIGTVLPFIYGYIKRNKAKPYNWARKKPL